MANDVNVKINVDASQAQKQTTDFRAQIRELTRQMTALQLAGKANTDEYRKLAAQLGVIKDAMDDTAAQARILSNDYFKQQAAMEGLAFGVNIFSGLAQAAALCGVENEDLQKTLVKLQAAQNLANTAMNIAKALNKDTALMTALNAIKNKLLTTEIKEQTKAQLALNIAKKASLGILAALTIAIGVAAKAWIDARDAQANFRKELDEKALPTIAEATSKVKLLQRQYNLLGDDLAAKKKFFEDHRDILKDTAKNTKDVADYDKAFIEQTTRYIEAQKLRAKANAAKEIAEGLIKEQLQVENLLDRLKSGELTTVEQVTLALSKFDGSVKEWILGANNYNTMIERATKVHAKREKEINHLYDVSVELNDSADKLTGYGDGDKDEKTDFLASINEKYSKIAETIKKKYLPSILQSEDVGLKMRSTKLQEAELLDNEIARLTELRMQYSENSSTYIKLGNSITELKYKRANLFNVTEETISAEDELNNLYEGNTTAIDNQAEAINNLNKKRKEDAKAWSEFLNKRINETEEANKKADEDAIQREKDIREAKLKTVETISQAAATASDFISALMDSELQQAEGNEAKQAQIRKKYAMAQFALQIGDIISSTAKAIMESWSAYAGIPFVGQGLAIAQSAIIGATGAAQVLNARTAMRSALSGKAARGAFITGRSHAEGGEIWELEGGEAVMNKKAMEIPSFRALASAMNEATGGISFTNNLSSTSNKQGLFTATVDKDTIRDIVVETVSGIVSIPVTVSESAITTAQRNVRVINSRASF